MGDFALPLVTDSYSTRGSADSASRRTVSGPTLSDATGLLSKAGVADLPVCAPLRR